MPLSKCAKYRTITFSLLIKLVSLLFTPVYYLPAKPISHQLSQRESFYLLVLVYNHIQVYTVLSSALSFDYYNLLCMWMKLYDADMSVCIHIEPSHRNFVFA